MKSLGRFARSVAMMTHLPVMGSLRNSGKEEQSSGLGGGTSQETIITIMSRRGCGGSVAATRSIWTEAVINGVWNQPKRHFLALPLPLCYFILYTGKTNETVFASDCFLCPPGLACLCGRSRTARSFGSRAERPLLCFVGGWAIVFNGRWR